VSGLPTRWTGRTTPLAGLGLAVGLLASPALAGDLRSATRDAATLAQWLDGRWSSAAQAARDSGYMDIQTSNVRIWAGDKAQIHYWFYGESAQAKDVSKPYRQNVFQLVPQEDGAVHSYQYRLRDPAKAAGLAARGEAPSLTMEDLIALPNCTLILRRKGRETFQGAMRAQDCRNTFRGADYLDASTRISARTLYTWDRGMNFKREQVWGPRAGGYLFDKMPAAPAP
jgi:hypothetical protein